MGFMKVLTTEKPQPAGFRSQYQVLLWFDHTPYWDSPILEFVAKADQAAQSVAQVFMSFMFTRHVCTILTQKKHGKFDLQE